MCFVDKEPLTTEDYIVIGLATIWVIPAVIVVTLAVLLKSVVQLAHAKTQG